MDDGTVDGGRLLMAGISAGWTLLLETPRYLPPRPTASGFREAVFRLDLDANLRGPQALFSPPG